MLIAKTYLLAYFDTYAFSSFMDLAISTDIVNRLINLRKGIFDIAKSHNYKLMMFSDSGYLLYELPKDVVRGNNPTEFRERINEFCQQVVHCYDAYLDKGLLIRGGISYGEIIVKKNFLLGTPVLEAVQLEREGIAPLLVVPYRLLQRLGGTGWPGIIEVPMKDNLFISARVIMPSNRDKWLELLEKAKAEACHTMSRYSGVLVKALNISKHVSNSYPIGQIK